LDSKLLCLLPGIEVALLVAASFSDRRIFCLAVFCGPVFRFPLGVVRPLYCFYCFDVATLLYTPPPTHTHTLTPDTSVVSASWQLTIYAFPSGQVLSYCRAVSNGCNYWGNLLLLLRSALQPLVGFGLLYDFIPQSSIFTIGVIDSTIVAKKQKDLLN